MTKRLSAIAVCALSLYLPHQLVAENIHPSDQAEVFALGSINVIDPWLKSEVGGGHSAKLFFEYRSEAQLSDKLVSVSSSIARGETNFIVVETSDQQRTLKKIQSIDFPAGSPSYELSEIGYYIELNGLKTPVLMGKRIPVTLTFKNAGAITIDVTARFHSPKLTRRIKEAAVAGDIEALKALRPLTR